VCEYQFSDHIDGHVHVMKVSETSKLYENLTEINSVQTGIVCQYENTVTNSNPAGFVMKSRDPGRFYILAGLEHSGLLFGAKNAISLLEQLHILYDVGVDGIKLLASKPTGRKRLGAPLDSPYFSDFFKECENMGISLLWHVADPEEFWEPEKLPEWAQEKEWGYDDSYSTKEDLYDETLNVLRRHPSLQVVFPHFFFLSADLQRANKLLNEFPHVNLDLSPGIELFYNMSLKKEETKEFFCEFSDRILFGTDILGSHSVEEMKKRTGIVYRFLTEDKEFRVPEKADFLLGKPGDGIIRGLQLPGGIVNSITVHNFHRIFGKLPRLLNVPAAREECLRLGRIESEVNSIPIKETEGHQAAEKLGKITIASPV
jgi:hypothetical protein